MDETVAFAWAVGFFEGEGHVRAKWRNQHRNRYDGCNFSMSITNSDRECLNQFCYIVGAGAIYPMKPNAFSKRPLWLWYLDDKDGDARAAQLAWRMYPMLSARRQQQVREAAEIVDKQRVLVADAKERWHALKLAVVEWYRTHDESMAAVGKRFGVHPQSVSNWVHGRGMVTHPRNIRRLGAEIPA